MEPDSDRIKSDRMVVESSARLHFGLTEICPGQPSLFGGCGITLDEPSTQLSIQQTWRESSNRLRWHVECDSPWKERIDAVLSRAEHGWCSAKEYDSEIGSEAFASYTLRIEKPPLAHVGLGSGTQLACCVATLVAAIQSGFAFNSSTSTMTASDIWKTVGARDGNPLGQLAKASGRGARSYVGLASHLMGGFIFDHGMPTEIGSRRTVDRIATPEAWRVLLVRSASSSTISGTCETDYFQRCAQPNASRLSMIDLVQREMIPAIQTHDLQRFGEALYQYGRYGGELFRAVQGGVYRDNAVAEMVEAIRELGVKGTGQTSWGPTVYAIVESQDEAIELDDKLRVRFGDAIITSICRPSNRPSMVKMG